MRNQLRYGVTVWICLVMPQMPQTLFAQLDYLESIKKIDVHTHMLTDAPYLRQILDDLNMKFCTMSPRGAAMRSKAPRYFAWIEMLDVRNILEPGWADRERKRLQQSFENGAVAVKIFKNVGMRLKNEQGEYVQVDDPLFEPLFEYLQAENRTVIAHLGEPIQAWMPPRPGTYWARNPEFSFWDKPDRPSYSDIMAARDHVLAKYPRLRFVGAHLGSLEFDVEEIAKRLDAYPNFAVEIGGRTRYFMWQARDKVREFLIKYQDRVMYGTDRNGGLKKRNGQDMTKADIAKSKAQILRRHDLFFRYYATSETIPWGDNIFADQPVGGPSYTVQGLALPKDVLDKIFYANAVKWFPGVDESFP